MKPNFNGLSPAEVERLGKLIEEMGEVAQIAGKILLHGYESTHPAGGPTNRELLQRELGDLWFILTYLGDHDVDTGKVLLWAAEKEKKIKQYWHHQEDQNP